MSVTCSTGIAATRYEKGQTLHKWCGIGAGGIPVSELVDLIRDDERYSDARKRISDCDVLFIDEVSMVSKKLFDSVELICRSIRGNDAYFGGIQIILSGDFYQLPPVPDELYGETGDYCFESKSFRSAVPHVIYLTQVFRQLDGNLITSVNEIERGEPSQQTIDYVKSLERDIPINDNTMFLFSSNLKANLYNHDRLKAMPGEAKMYHSNDEGDSYYLNKFQAPKVLCLKVGCPVMLVVNLSDTLVNGTTGKVKQLTEDAVIVHFHKPDQTIKLDRYLFTKIDPVSRRTLAKRLQFPIILCFGITMHRSQGMSCESVVVDCESARTPGQIGVALGRAVSPDNLQVKNFKPGLITPHPQKVKNFYAVPSKPLRPDHTCCKIHYIPFALEVELFTPFENDTDTGLDEVYDDDDDDDDDDHDDDDHDDDDVLPLNPRNDDTDTTQDSQVLDIPFYKQRPLPTPDYIDSISILKSVSEEYSNTPLKDGISAIVEDINKRSEPFEIWLSSQFLSINKMADENMPDAKTVENKNVTRFCSDVNTYMKRENYFESCIDLFSNYTVNVDKAKQFFCTSICFHIQKVLIKKKQELLATAPIPERHVPTEKYEEGKGSVRYIGGYCISKLRSKQLKKIQNSLFHYNDVKKERILEENRLKSSLLLQLIVPSSVIAETSQYPETLEVTARKQNIRQGLTNISDKAYLFFESLNHRIRQLETFQNLNEYGQNVVEYIKSKLLENSNLMQEWMLLFRVAECDDDDDDSFIEEAGFISELYVEIISKYVKVSASHFRKDYLQFIKREKGKAHRKKVLEKNERKVVVKITIKDIRADKSGGRKVSHLKLQAGVIDDKEYFNDSKFLKKDLLKLCEAYDIAVSKSVTKKQLNDTLINVILQSESMPTPDVLSEEHETNVPSTSAESIVSTSPTTTPDMSQKEQGKGRGKGKGKGKRTKSCVGKSKEGKKRKKGDKEVSDENSDCCAICSGKYDDSPDWKMDAW